MVKRSHLLRRGAIVMLRTNGGYHPCVMLTDAFKRHGKGRARILVVNLTTAAINGERDSACEFKEGHGKRIIAGSYVLYAELRLRNVADLEAEIAKHDLRVAMLERAVFERVIGGLFRSQKTSEEAMDYYIDARRQGKAD